VSERLRGRAAAHDLPAGAAILAAAAGFAAVLWGWSQGGGVLELPWAPTLDLNLRFELDGLGALYTLLATGVGLAVFVYAGRYLPGHLAHQRRPPSHAPRFYGLLVLFMVSMAGLATAQDLVLLFVFWDLTAVASYFLIAYDRHEVASRWAALMALLVTGVSAVLLLIGTLVLYAEYGTFSVPELFQRAQAGGTLTLAGGLIAVAALAKSAQVPLHFWLPRAMTAPTPVSAYLHSAAMVAAGVLLLGRLYPLIEPSEALLDGLLVVGAASIAVGGVTALTRDDMKQLLAYSTFSQYGYVVFLYGLGGAKAAAAAAFYVVAHALAKSALFLTAGAVTEATGGAKKLSQLGGLARELPLLAAASAAAAATIAALPLTVGFFADELFFAAALERGPGAAAIAVAAAGLTLAYLGRFWAAIFLGARRKAGRVPIAMLAPVAALAACVVVGGVWAEPLSSLAAAAGESTVRAPASASVAYHLDARAENVMAAAAWAIGLALLALPGSWRALARSAAELGSRAGPERLYGCGLRRLNELSDRVHDLEVRDLRTRVAALLVPAGALALLGLLATPTAGSYRVEGVELGDMGLVLMLVLACVAAAAATLPRRHLSLALVLATLGFALAGVYAFFGAPDVALVAVVVETLLALLVLGVLALVPAQVLRREANIQVRGSRRWRDPLVALLSGAFASVLAWSALSRPAPERSVAAAHVELASDAHAKDVVTAILADFRGLDTLGEVTVVAVGMAGVVALLRRGRLW